MNDSPSCAVPTPGRTSLAQFLVDHRRRAVGISDDLAALIVDVAKASTAIARDLAGGALTLTCDAIVESGVRRRGDCLLVFDPLDGLANIDVNMTGGSFFSVLTANAPDGEAVANGLLQPETRPLCAGYALWGPATLLVLSLGNGTHAFALDQLLGEFLLFHEDLRIPVSTRESAISAFSLRSISSLVPDVHRTLKRGGVLLLRDGPVAASSSERQRLMCKASAIALLIEQAGGSSSLHERSELAFGSRDEVALIGIGDGNDSRDDYASPLFARRGLYASPD